MIKGKTIIELTDVHTGEVERHEDDNMVTNALNKIFEPVGHIKSSDKLFSTYAPYYQKLLGGIMLFDGQIDENPNTYFPPDDVRLTGCGVYNMQNSTKGTTRGNFNVTESEYDAKNKQVKYVYDFTTSQGNGTIACACLTSNLGGYSCYGSNGAAQYGGIAPKLEISNNSLRYTLNTYTGGTTAGKEEYGTVGTTEFIFAINPDEDMVYYLRVDSAHSISIVKRKAFLKGVSVFDKPYSVKPISDIITLDIQTELNTGYFDYNYSDRENKLYVIFYEGSRALADKKIQVIKIQVDNWEIEEFEFTNNTGVELRQSSSFHNRSFGYEDYIYIPNSKRPTTEMYKINIQDPDDTLVTDNEYLYQISSGENFAFALNGHVFLETIGRNDTSSYGAVINTKDNVLLKPESSGWYGDYSTGLSGGMTYVPLLGNNFMQWVTSAGSFLIPAFYLATINNLSSPVTKTADKTMKVTYVIQEVDE